MRQVSAMTKSLSWFLGISPEDVGYILRRLQPGQQRMHPCSCISSFQSARVNRNGIHEALTVVDMIMIIANINSVQASNRSKPAVDFVKFRNHLNHTPSLHTPSVVGFPAIRMFLSLAVENQG